MATNTLHEDADYLSLPVPANTKSGAPVRVGEINAVTQTAEGDGGNPAGSASCMLKGSHSLSVTLAASGSVGDPVFIAGDNSLSDTNTDPQFGVLLEDAAAGTADLAVRVDQY